MSKIVMVQRRATGILLGVPAELRHIVKDVDYMRCEECDGGLKYTRID